MLYLPIFWWNGCPRKIPVCHSLSKALPTLIAFIDRIEAPPITIESKIKNQVLPCIRLLMNEDFKAHFTYNTWQFQTSALYFYNSTILIISKGSKPATNIRFAVYLKFWYSLTNACHKTWGYIRYDDQCFLNADIVFLLDIRWKWKLLLLRDSVSLPLIQAARTLTDVYCAVNMT